MDGSSFLGEAESICREYRRRSCAPNIPVDPELPSDDEASVDAAGAELAGVVDSCTLTGDAGDILIIGLVSGLAYDVVSSASSASLSFKLDICVSGTCEPSLDVLRNASEWYDIDC